MERVEVDHGIICIRDVLSAAECEVEASEPVSERKTQDKLSDEAGARLALVSEDGCEVDSDS